MTAILESNPTSMFTDFRMIFSGVYPNVTLSSCSNGGEIFSASGNLAKVRRRARGRSASNFRRRRTKKEEKRLANALERLALLSLGRFQIRQFLEDLDLRLSLRSCDGE